MKFNSLQFKLSLLFVLLLLAVSAVNIYMVTESSENYLAEVMQRRNTDLAASIAQTLNIDSATNAVPPKEIESLFKAAMIINPSIELYLIGHDGVVMNASAKPGELKLQTVNTANIEALLNQSQPLPIFGQDPREPGSPKVFSAHPLNKDDGTFHCYLYIVLSNEHAPIEKAASVRQSFIMKALFRTLLIAMGVTLVIGLFMIFFLTRNLKKMSEAVHSIENGDYSVRIDIKSSDELSELGSAFNTMAEKIETSMQKLRHNDELRRELIANISHDLRTPLASLEGYIETILLKEHLLTEEEKKSYLETILKNTKSLGRLVSELFQLSKLEAKQTELQPEIFSITELIQDILLKFMPKAKEADVKLFCYPEEQVPLVFGDISLIERVLQNLIENAIAYTPRQGKVLVNILKASDTQVRIEITDTGKGIHKKDLEHIFDRFYRSDRVRPKTKQGLGLGLAIAKKIVELHGSDLQVISKVGQGTTFFFVLDISEKFADTVAVGSRQKQ